MIREISSPMPEFMLSFDDEREICAPQYQVNHISACSTTLLPALYLLTLDHVNLSAPLPYMRSDVRSDMLNVSKIW